jgi:hypothetical protein
MPSVVDARYHVVLLHADTAQGRVICTFFQWLFFALVEECSVVVWCARLNGIIEVGSLGW